MWPIIWFDCFLFANSNCLIFHFLLIRLKHIATNSPFIRMNTLTDIWLTILVTHLVSCIALDAYKAYTNNQNASKLYAICELANVYTSRSVGLTLVNIVLVAPYVLKLWLIDIVEEPDSSSSSSMLVTHTVRWAGFCCVGFVCFDVWFEIHHRLLHRFSFLYHHIHSVHHTESKDSHAIHSLVMHPTEFALVMVCGIILGPNIVHLFWQYPVSYLRLYVALSVFVNAYVHAYDHNHLMHHSHPTKKQHMSAIGLLHKINK